MPLDCVEGFGAADVCLGTAFVFGHELHEHHDELVDRLVVYTGVLRQQIFDDGVFLRRRAFTCTATASVYCLLQTIYLMIIYSTTDSLTACSIAPHTDISLHGSWKSNIGIKVYNPDINTVRNE